MSEERPGSVTITVGRKSVTVYQPTVGAVLRQRKLEEGKCEALGCQQFVGGGGYCKNCAERQLRTPK